MTFQVSQRVLNLPPYPFAELDRIVAGERRRGVTIVDMGVGDPDIFPPLTMIDGLKDSLLNGVSHLYPPYTGIPELNEAVSLYFRERFGVPLDPEGEVLPLLGTKEGIFHIPLIVLNPGDTALVPDPAYPVYRNGVKFAGGVPVPFLIRRGVGFLPDLNEIRDLSARERPKMLFINYPNNPTGRVAHLEFFEELVRLCRQRGILLVNDAAYIEIYHSSPPPSLLQVEGAKDVSIEFHSLSKTFSCAGWRVGFAVGGERVIRAFKELKTNIDSGIFIPLQVGAARALRAWREEGGRTRREFSKRVFQFDEALRGRGYSPLRPEATFYIWMETGGAPSEEFASLFVRKFGIVSAPGNAFGRGGEGFVRFSLTLPAEGLSLALERIRNGG